MLVGHGLVKVYGGSFVVKYECYSFLSAVSVMLITGSHAVVLRLSLDSSRATASSSLRIPCTSCRC